MRFATFVMKTQQSMITQSSTIVSPSASKVFNASGIKQKLLFAAVLLCVGCTLAGRTQAQNPAKPDQNDHISSENTPINSNGELGRSEQGTVNNVGDGSSNVVQSSMVDGKPNTAQSAVVSPDPDGLRNPNKAFDSSIPAAAFVTHHPPGSVKSVVDADDVLTDVTKARDEVELRNLNDRRVCYKMFFTNHCLDAAKEKRRLALKQIRPLEVEANAFKRRATADDRDKALAAQQAKSDISAPKLQQEQKDTEGSIAKKLKDGAEHDAEVTANTKLHAGEAEKRISDNANKLQQIHQNDAAKASERAGNRAAFAKKGQDAADRQRKVAEKKAEKARQLAEKKVAPTVKPALTTPPATPAPP